MNIWITTDWHLNHDGIIEYENRPTNYKEIILREYEKVVKDEDLVINLGDLIFKRPSEIGDIISKLKGKRVLVRGNHDHNTNEWYMNKGFDLSCDKFEFEYQGTQIVFSHKPIETDGINIHGHFHTHGHRYLSEFPFYSEKNIAVSIEVNKYKPVLLKTILKNK